MDLAVVVFYFALVLGIGFYLKGRSKTGEDSFRAGRETGWTYQYGILAAHAYWIAAIPAMIFLGIVMMPFYYIGRTHSVPGYLELRFNESTRALYTMLEISDGK